MLFAKIFNGKIDKIIIYPFGGISKFKIPLNISPNKELLITIAGPIFQIIAYYTMMSLCHRYHNIIRIYHYSILIFNLLPIYPLDGGKIVNILLSFKLPFKLSLKLTICISYMTLIFFIIINYPNFYLNFIIITIYLLYKITIEERQIECIYNKFLLERYLYNYHFKNKKIIKTENNFYKNTKHIIKKNNNYYLEREFLEKKYKNI